LTSSLFKQVASAFIFSIRFVSTLRPRFLVRTFLANHRLFGSVGIYAGLDAVGRLGDAHPVGQKQNPSFLLSFRASLKVDFQWSRVSPDGGQFLVRELDEQLGLNQLIQQHVTDSGGKNTQLLLADLLRRSVYNRVAR
jgi:hypothetical protein